MNETRSGNDAAPVCLFAAGLVAAALLAYAGSFTAPFLLDDYRWIVEDPAVRELGSLGSITRSMIAPRGLDVGRQLRAGRTRCQGISRVQSRRPRHGRLAAVRNHPSPDWPGEPASSRQLPATGLAFAIALVWLIHPLQTQSVTYVIQRCESMMGMFLFLCLYGVVRAAEARRAWPWYVLAVAACGLGMGCKEVMLTAPPWRSCWIGPSWPRPGGSCSGVAACCTRRCLPSALALLVMNLSKMTGDGDVSAGFDSTVVTPVAYLRTQPAVILHYLRLAFWPRPLCLDYHWPVADSPLEIYPAAAAVIAMLVASVVAFRYWPGLGFLGLSFFVVLAPTSSIMPIADLAFEHRMYVPLAAVVDAGRIRPVRTGAGSCGTPLPDVWPPWGPGGGRVRVHAPDLGAESGLPGSGADVGQGA